MSNDKPDYLIKFTDAEGAVRILSDQMLRWSSPDRFADPFELSAKSTIPFDPTSLLESTIKLASSMVFAPEQPKGESPLINAIRRWRDEDRFSSTEEAHGVLHELLSKMVEDRQAQLRSALAHWREYVRNVRLCCFSAKVDNVVGWEQFADNHRGIALRFSLHDDPNLASARPVFYQNERPQLTTLREQLSAILHNRRDTVLDRFKEHFLIKGNHRRQEQEWRCLRVSERKIDVDDHAADTWFDDHPFAAEQITGVFFGIHTEPEIKQVLVSLIKTKYPSAKMFQAVSGKSTYSIEFERLL